MVAAPHKPRKASNSLRRVESVDIASSVFLIGGGTVGRCQSKRTGYRKVCNPVGQGDAQTPQVSQPVPLFQLIARGDPPGGDDVCVFPAVAAER